jgi:3,4-dihydroxy 2-butanone 4-phosphate synthase/GTP cyclohydrolase II
VGDASPRSGGSSTREFSTITQALTALRRGEPVIVVAEDDLESTGAIVLAAELASVRWVTWAVRNSSGFLTAPITNELADRLDLPLMVNAGENQRGTAYTVTVDAADGPGTGISARDRAHTLRVLADPSSTPERLTRPGHLLPIRAATGGFAGRAGHVEAAVALVALAGLCPVAALCEVVGGDGEMMRLPALLDLGERESVPIVTIGLLAGHLEVTTES